MNDDNDNPFDVDTPDAIVFHDDDSAVELRDVGQLRGMVPPEPRPVPERPVEEDVPEWTPGGRWQRANKGAPRDLPGFVAPLVRAGVALLIISVIFLIAWIVFDKYTALIQT